MIGRHVLENLLTAEPGAQFAVLTRRPEAVGTRNGRVIPLAGDLRLPRFGLPPEIWDALQRNLAGIVHSAAEIRFDLPLDEARAVNVAGTQTILNLASGCRNLQRLAHVSTTYVTGRSQDPLPEGPFLHPQGFFSSYQESKYEAEQLVIDSFGALPAAIFRLSTVIGDSRSGAVEQYNHFHQLLRLAPRSLLPVLPGSPSARVDFVATDWTTTALSWCFSQRFEAGTVRNFCAGPDSALPIQEVLDMTYDRLGGGRPPELVTREEFDRYVRGRLLRGEFRLAQLLKALEYLLPYFSLRQNFQNAETLALLESAHILPPDSRTLFRRVLNFMAPPDRTAASPRHSVPAREPVG